MFYNAIYMTFLKSQNYSDRKQMKDCQEPGVVKKDCQGRAQTEYTNEWVNV